MIYANKVDISPSSEAPLSVEGTASRIVACNTPMLPNTVFVLTCGKRVPITNLPKYMVCTEEAVFSLILPEVTTNRELDMRSFAILKRNKLYLGYRMYACPGYKFKGWWSRKRLRGRFVLYGSTS